MYQNGESEKKNTFIKKDLTSHKIMKILMIYFALMIQKFLINMLIKRIEYLFQFKLYGVKITSM